MPLVTGTTPVAECSWAGSSTPLRDVAFVLLELHENHGSGLSHRWAKRVPTTARLWRPWRVIHPS